MSTPSGDSVRDEIRENALVAGNPVKTSSKLPATGSKQIYVDSSGNFASGDLPFAPVVVAQSTTDALEAVTGTPNGNIMTQSLVAAASATTFTVGGYMRMQITSLNEAIMSSGAYYIQVGTLT